MVRLIITYQIYQIVHDCIDKTHLVHHHEIRSVVPSLELVELYDPMDIIERDELLSFDKVVYHSSVCQDASTHHNSINSIPIQYRHVIQQCEYEYWFASTAYLIEPKWTRYQLEYDQVIAEHDGYCSDTDELDWQVNSSFLVSYEPIEDHMLGIDENNEDVLITKEFRKLFQKNELYSSGSGYCLYYNPHEIYKDVVTECNIPYLVLTRCTKVD